MNAKCLTVAVLLFAACRAEERPAPRAPAPRRDVVRSSVTPPPAAAMQTGEDPPYLPDSVFRPETHRGPDPVLPPDALLIRDTITGEQTREFNYFGEAVAIDGDVTVIGAPYADEGRQTDSGVAYVFRREGDAWRQEARLTSPMAQAFERFGVSVAVSGDVIVVGADRSDQDERTDSGAAFVFARRGGAWRHEVTLVPEELRGHSALGFAVAVHRNVAVLGAPGAEAVFVYRRNDKRWIEEAKLTIPQHWRASFGHAVAVDGDVLVAGAMTHSEPLHHAGAAFVFRRVNDAWTPEADLRAPRAHELARFGAAVAIRGGRALVSAPRATVDNTLRAGAAWLFTRADFGWRAAQEIHAQPPRGDEEFGRALSLTAEGAVIGSQFSDAAGLGTGAAALFAFDQDLLVRRGTFLAADLEPMNEFAFALAATERDVVIGAPRRGENDNATGYAYVYRMEARP